MATTCDVCGAELVIGGGPGEWCKGDPSYHLPGTFGRTLLAPMDPYVDVNILPRDDPRVKYGGYKNENGTPGILIETRSDRRKLMREQNLQYGGQHPGGREL